MYPAGGIAKLRVIAVPSSGTNGVQKVEFQFDSPATVVTATAVSGVPNAYEAPYTVPSSPDGTVVNVHVVATSVSGNTSDISTPFTTVTGSFITAPPPLPPPHTPH